MYQVKARKNTRARRKLSIRKRIFGTAEAPRLSVFRSNKYVYAQLIDDATGHTLVSADSEAKKLHEKRLNTEAAFNMGNTLAKKALAKGIKKAVFDRNGYRYHGRVAKLAEGARDGGLEL